MTNKKSMPEKTFRAGSVSVSIFENTVKTKDKSKIVIPSAVFQKRYKDEKGEWRSTNRLNVNDIPRAVLCLQNAYEHILSLKREQALSRLESE